MLIMAHYNLNHIILIYGVDNKYMASANMKHQIKTLTAQNDFEIRNVCDFNYSDIASDYHSFHNHDFYEYFLVVQGKGVHYVNGIETPLFRNVFVALKPSDVHSFSVKKGETIRILNLAFCKEIALPIIKIFEIEDTDIADCCERQVYEDASVIKGHNNKPLPENSRAVKSFHADRVVMSSFFPSNITLSDSQASEIVNQYHNLHIKSHPENPEFPLLKAFFSYLFSIAVMNNGKDSLESSGFPDWLRHSIVSLSEMENYVQGLSYLIQSTGRNQSYLCRTFRRYMNCTPTEYINSLRLKNACNLLTYTPRSIVDICFECGFSSVSHFNHLFKKSYEISPTAFRSRSL